MLNGEGFTYDQFEHLWVVDVATGSARRLTSGRTSENRPRCRRRTAGGSPSSPTGGSACCSSGATSSLPTPSRARSRPSPAVHARSSTIRCGCPTVRRSRRSATASRRARAAATMCGSSPPTAATRNPTRTQPVGRARPHARLRDEQRRHPRRGGASRGLGRRPLAHLQRADRGRVRAVADRGRRRPRRAPHGGRHYISGWDHGKNAHLYLRSTPPETPRPVAARAARRDTAACRRSTASSSRKSSCARPSSAGSPSRAARSGLADPERFRPAPARRRDPRRAHTLYGWSPFWEFQILAANGMSVFACNPRGSEGYGEAFNAANYRDWGPGPTRDVLAGRRRPRRRRPGRS